jgi:hypothetical protein
MNYFHALFAESASTHPGSVMADRWTFTVTTPDVHNEHGQWCHETNVEWATWIYRAQPAMVC